MVGTFVNAGAILIGALAGAALGGRLLSRVRTTVTDLLGLFVVVLGILDALETFGPTLGDRLGRASALVVLGALLLGGILGELIDIEAWLRRLGERLRDAVLATSERDPGNASAATSEESVKAFDEGAPHPSKDSRHRFVEGFVVMTLLVCVGPLAVLGSIEDGLTGSIQLLSVKSVLDGFAALAFASAFGIGVAFAAVPLLLYQGALTFGASGVGPYITEPMVAAITSVGGFLVIGIGLRLLEVRPIRVGNLLPGLLLAPLAVALWP